MTGPGQARTRRLREAPTPAGEVWAEAIPGTPSLQARELGLTRWLYSLSRYRAVTALLSLVSRLANGVLWYAIMAVLPFIAADVGWECDGRMLAVGLANLALYYPVKRWASRRRPFAVVRDILPLVATLDEFSFPSGHTMHAVAFSLVLAHYFPPLLVPLGAFTVLVAISRVALGVHYPSDVAVGALIGMVTATAVAAFLVN